MSAPALTALVQAQSSRAQALAGLRELSTFLSSHPDLPVPRELVTLLAPSSDEEGRAQIALAATELGVRVKHAPNGTLRAERAFGPVRYAVVYMPMLLSHAPIGGVK